MPVAVAEAVVAEAVVAQALNFALKEKGIKKKCKKGILRDSQVKKKEFFQWMLSSHRCRDHGGLNPHHRFSLRNYYKTIHVSPLCSPSEYDNLPMYWNGIIYPSTFTASGQTVYSAHKLFNYSERDI